MKKRTRWLVIGTLSVTALGAGAGIAVAGGSDDSEARITGSALERASAAALEHTGEGHVTDTEVGDEEGYYEVEVTLDDGSQVDVHLDQDFQVLSTEGDGADDEGRADD